MKEEAHVRGGGAESPGIAICGLQTMDAIQRYDAINLRDSKMRGHEQIPVPNTANKKQLSAIENYELIPFSAKTSEGQLPATHEGTLIIFTILFIVHDKKNYHAQMLGYFEATRDNDNAYLLEELGRLEALEEVLLVEGLGPPVVDLVEHPALQQLLVTHPHLFGPVTVFDVRSVANRVTEGTGNAQNCKNTKR